MNAKMQPGGADRAREMAVFSAVAASGSFSAAGRDLDLTPSAVSRTIDRVEARLGVRLMLRTTRTLTLTPEGQAYLGAARRILYLTYNRLSDGDHREAYYRDKSAAFPPDVARVPGSSYVFRV